MASVLSARKLKETIKAFCHFGPDVDPAPGWPMRDRERERAREKARESLGFNKNHP